MLSRNEQSRIQIPQTDLEAKSQEERRITLDFGGHISTISVNVVINGERSVSELLSKLTNSGIELTHAEYLTSLSSVSNQNSERTQVPNVALTQLSEIGLRVAAEERDAESNKSEEGYMKHYCSVPILTDGQDEHLTISKALCFPQTAIVVYGDMGEVRLVPLDTKNARAYCALWISRFLPETAPRLVEILLNCDLLKETRQYIRQKIESHLEEINRRIRILEKKAPSSQPIPPTFSQTNISLEVQSSYARQSE